MPKFVGLVAALAVGASAGVAQADDALTEYLGAREMAVGESMRAAAHGALATVLNPSGISLTRELVFEGAVSHTMGGATVVTASGCDSTVRIPGCYYYRYLTASPEVGDATFSRRVHEGGIALSRLLNPRLHGGINVRYFDYEADAPGAEADDNGVTADAGLTFLANNIVSVAAVGYNLVGANSAQYPLAIGAGIVAQPISSLSIAIDGLWHLEGAEGQSTGRYGGGAQLFLRSADGQNGYPLRAGAVYDARGDATHLTAGVGMVSAKLGLDVGARVQIAGGDDIAVVASLRLFGPRDVMPANMQAP